MTRREGPSILWYANGFKAEEKIRLGSEWLTTYWTHTGKIVGALRWKQPVTIASTISAIELDATSPHWPGDQDGPSAPWARAGVSATDWWKMVSPRETEQEFSNRLLHR
jgi:hypothetical protein